MATSITVQVKGPHGVMYPVILDADLAEDFDPIKWRVFHGRGKVPYVHAYAGIERKPTSGWKTLWVHLQRVVNMTPRGMLTDHQNGNTLDNRRENLRTCTTQQNQCNARVRRDGSSGFRGVKWHSKNKNWTAMIKAKGIDYYLGSFFDKEEAARAYNEAAKKYHGEFARLNPI